MISLNPFQNRQFLLAFLAFILAPLFHRKFDSITGSFRIFWFHFDRNYSKFHLEGQCLVCRKIGCYYWQGFTCCFRLATPLTRLWSSITITYLLALCLSVLSVDLSSIVIGLYHFKISQLVQSINPFSSDFLCFYRVLYKQKFWAILITFPFVLCKILFLSGSYPLGA